MPSPKLQNWLIEFSNLCKKSQHNINSISFYCVTSKEVDLKNLWISIFRENNFSFSIYPPVLQLKLGEGGITLEKNVLESVKNYAHEFIEFFINKKNGGI